MQHYFVLCFDGRLLLCFPCRLVKRKNSYILGKVKNIPVINCLHIVASNADPAIQRKAEELKRCKLKDDLNKKLQRRPGPLELITKKILQADAELEQAIQGYLSF